jgi:hypothetical protein
MNRGEMRTKTRRKLNEASATFWTDTDINDALNEGYAEMADASEFYERQAMVPTLKGRTYYDLSLILPDTFLSPRRAYNPVTSRWLDPTDPLQQDHHNFVQWELTQGEPIRYLMRGNWWMGVWPKPAQDGPGMRLLYTAIPEAMSADTDEPLFPVEFHEGIPEFAISELLGQSRVTTLALAHWKRYRAYEEALTAYVDGRISLAQVSVL